MSDEPEGPKDCDNDEFVIPGPPLPNGGRMCIHHAGDHTVRPAMMVPLEDGRALDDNAMLLEPREGSNVYDVVGTVAEMKKGPSKVNSPAYKRGWDNIFGKPSVSAGSN